MQTKKILIVRPRGSGFLLKEKLDAAGFEGILFPSIEIHPIAINAKDTLLLFANTAHKIIFTSVYAVHFSKKIFSQRASYTKVYAVGAATAESLKEQGVAHAITPEHYSSEGLLALPDFQSVSNERIVIITGKNPRALLKETLEARGAQVEEMICYERACPHYPETEIEKITRQHFDAILVYSLEALQNLEKIFVSHLDWLKAQQLLVVTSSMQQYCAEQHYLKPALLSDNVSDAAVIANIKL